MADTNGSTNGSKTLRDRVVEWLFQQGVSTVLLVAIFALLAYFGNYWLKEGLPAQTKEIQAGYERLAQQHSKVEEANRQAFEKAIGYILDQQLRNPPLRN
jgi:hypothetical protein